MKQLAVCLSLAAITWAVFGPTVTYDFINYDDNSSVYENVEVTKGLSLHGIGWALTHSDAELWNPLSTISHMMDCQLFGLKPTGHHFMNVLLHSLTVIGLFLVLHQMTDAFWRSAFVAAVFAVHPLRVESVAWVVERKDVLSGFFFVLTLGAYFYYVRKQGLWRYSLVAFLFLLGLMSKAVLVTLPFVLLLLDYWPLRRFDNAQIARSTYPHWLSEMPAFGRLVAEKSPLLLLSAGSSFVTLVSQKTAISSLDKLPLLARLDNALFAVVDYIAQAFWPVRLAVYYPYGASAPPLWQIVLQIVLLLAISTSVFAFREKRSYLVTGWLWFLGMLVPNIGIVQAGSQSHADRFTYLPHIGLYIMVTWAIADLLASWRQRHLIMAITAGLAIIALMWRAQDQTKFWRNSESLWVHALAVTPDNPVAEGSLGSALMSEGKIDEAIVHFKKGLEIWPSDTGARNNLGNALLEKGQLEDAIACYRKALELKPDNAMACYNLGVAYFRKGDFDQASFYYQKALDIHPDYPDAYDQLGNTQLRKGEIDAAIASWERSLNNQPENIATRNNLAIVLAQRGHLREAVAQWEKVLDVDPGNVDAQNALAWIFAASPEEKIRNGTRAVRFAEGAVRSSAGKSSAILRTLAAAYAESSRFAEAIRTGEQAMQMAESEHQFDLRDHIDTDLQLYRSQLPVRDKTLVQNEDESNKP